MFTGLIEEIGTLASVREKTGGREIAISCKALLEDLKAGDSVAVDGVCLTVEKKDTAGFTATATSETLYRSTLSKARAGNRVNLERALRLQDRLGGHIVQGHVDTVGAVVRDRREGVTLFRTVRIDADHSRYVAEKGSVTVDGVSLTVTRKEGTEFTVALIPETLKRTTLEARQPGDPVNVEIDILARYLESLTAGKGGLTLDKLKENGF